jgi:N-acetyl-anhydromuramyl-L-alanine amidase AmpD
MDIGVKEIRDWHVNGNGWSDIGYHYVIRRNGEVEVGRPESVAGAHTRGSNSNSIGICLVGGEHRDGGDQKADANFTLHQWAALAILLKELRVKYPAASVSGHRTYDSHKTCPTFDAAALGA